ncbi:MAG: hypothetical protein ACO1O1_04415 [Adhaeribacter sp.]
MNILGVEITPDDSPLRGATNRTGISGKTMLEQMSHQAPSWTAGSEEIVASEAAQHPDKEPAAIAGAPFPAGTLEPPLQPEDGEIVGHSNWRDQVQDPELGMAPEAALEPGMPEE